MRRAGPGWGFCVSARCGYPYAYVTQIWSRRKDTQKVTPAQARKPKKRSRRSGCGLLSVPILKVFETKTLSSKYLFSPPGAILLNGRNKSPDRGGFRKQKAGRRTVEGHVLYVLSQQPHPRSLSISLPLKEEQMPKRGRPVLQNPQ